MSSVVGTGCLLWPVHSLGKTLLAFALLCFVLQGQICLLLQGSLDFLLLHSSPLWWKGHLYLVLVLEGLVGLHRTVQFQLLVAQTWITMMLNGLPWKQTRSFFRFWDCIQVLHFRLFCWLYRASPSLAAKNIINLILVLTIWWCPVLLEQGVCCDRCILLAKLC